MAGRDYWNESVECALNEAGVAASPEQINLIAASIVASKEHESLADGSWCIPNPLTSEIERIKSDRSKELEQTEKTHAKAISEKDEVIRSLRSTISEMAEKLRDQSLK